MPRIEPPTIEPLCNIQLQQILLETARNAKHITPEMQQVIAQYVGFQSRPIMFVKGMKPTTEDVSNA